MSCSLNVSASRRLRSWTLRQNSQRTWTTGTLGSKVYEAARLSRENKHGLRLHRRRDAKVLNRIRDASSPARPDLLAYAKADCQLAPPLIEKTSNRGLYRW